MLDTELKEGEERKITLGDALQMILSLSELTFKLVREIHVSQAALAKNQLVYSSSRTPDLGSRAGLIPSEAIR